MRDEEEINPLEDILYENKNQSNIIDIIDIIDRKNISIYMSPSIQKAFSRYSKFTGKILALCVEEAFLEYMKNHPVNQVSLHVTNDMRVFLPSLADSLNLKMVKANLKKRLEVTIRLHQIGNNTNIQNNVNKFQKAIKKALKIKNPDPGLTELLRKSEEYL